MLPVRWACVREAGEDRDRARLSYSPKVERDPRRAERTRIRSGISHIAYREDGYAAGTIRSRIQAWGLARGHKIVAHSLRKNAVNKLIEVGCMVAQTSAASGQSLQLVEHYAKRRNRSTLGSSAMLIWSENEK